MDNFQNSPQNPSQLLSTSQKQTFATTAQKKNNQDAAIRNVKLTRFENYSQNEDIDDDHDISDSVISKVCQFIAPKGASGYNGSQFSKSEVGRMHYPSSTPDSSEIVVGRNSIGSQLRRIGASHKSVSSVSSPSKSAAGARKSLHVKGKYIIDLAPTKYQIKDVIDEETPRQKMSKPKKEVKFWSGLPRSLGYIEGVNEKIFQQPSEEINPYLDILEKLYHLMGTDKYQRERIDYLDDQCATFAETQTRQQRIHENFKEMVTVSHLKFIMDYKKCDYKTADEHYLDALDMVLKRREDLSARQKVNYIKPQEVHIKAFEQIMMVETFDVFKELMLVHNEELNIDYMSEEDYI